MKKALGILALVVFVSGGMTSCTSDANSEASMYETVKATDGDDVQLDKRSTDGDDVQLDKRT